MNGRTSASYSLSEAFVDAASISLWLRRYGFPVSFLRRCARLSRMVGSYVSGRRSARNTRAKPEIQMSSYIGHLQPLACAGNPPVIGYLDQLHRLIEYARRALTNY